MRCSPPRSFVSTIALVLAFLVLPAGSSAEEEHRFTLEFEAGPVWQTRNDVQIPNDASGTRFSLVELVGRGPWTSARFDLGWNINRHHGLHVLLAPLAYTETGTPEVPVSFAGRTYQAGMPTDATYQFNSWRLGYRYRFRDGERWTWSLGFTAKLRDAKIELRQGSLASKDTDLGFVPLLHFGADGRLVERWFWHLEIEGLAGGPGRAIDAALKLGYEVHDRFVVAGGYRTLEGGADVDAVYNFAWLHYAVVSATLRL